MTAGPEPLMVYGATTCEDTAIVRSRLRALGIPFGTVDVDVDEAAATRLREIHGGDYRTPTLVFGEMRLVLVEPSVDELDEALSAAGYRFERPTAVDFRADMLGPLELGELPAVGGGRLAPEMLAGRQTALFLAHDASCLACYGYAKRLAALREPLAESDAWPLIVVTDRAAAAAAWRREIEEPAVIAADQAGSWRLAAAAVVDRGPGQAMLLLLDGRLVPMAGSFGPEAGELMSPLNAMRWLKSLAR